MQKNKVIQQQIITERGGRTFGCWSEFLRVTLSFKDEYRTSSSLIFSKRMPTFDEFFLLFQLDFSFTLSQDSTLV